MEKRWKTNREKPELLIPAKDLEVLRTAVNFGADAVYIGGEAFSLRAKARNFSPEDMRAGIAYAHEHGVHVHVAANIFAHNQDLDRAAAYFEELAQMGPDAVLVADPGMFSLARQFCPEIPIHISTQANNTNYGTFRFWHDMGAARVVCARELSLSEIAPLSTAPCASLIREDAFCPPGLQGAMPTAVPAHIPADGNMPSRKRPGRVSISLSRKTSAEPISSIHATCA